MNQTETGSSPPGFLVAGTSSGSGKTTVTLGLMAAFRKRGLSVAPFKCGPDFIDPGLHTLVTGEISRNLDRWMAGDDFCRWSFHQNSTHHDLSIVEGVMGMFDGGASSSAQLSHLLQIPLVLVIDVRSMAESAAAIVHGFSTLNPKTPVAGVILNRIGSKRHLQLVEDAIDQLHNIEVLGHLPRDIDFTIPSRHLGLLTGEEAPLSQEAISKLADQIERYIDLDRILNMSSRIKRSALSPPLLPIQETPKCRIGVARDKAFCFYYEDTFDILRSCGAEIVFFSPLTDTTLPPDLDGLYLGGGYPELYARELSENRSMIAQIQNWIRSDRVVYAECGGFMYLTRGIYDHDDQFHTLVGAFPTQARMQTRRASLGYREVTTTKATCFGAPGQILRGHEFHYSSIEEMGAEVDTVYQLSSGGTEGYLTHRTLGGYMHLHFGSSVTAAENFINSCMGI